MRAVALFVLAAGAIACGGAPSPQSAAAVAPSPEPEPTTVEEAEQQVQRARQELDRDAAPAVAQQAAEPAGSSPARFAAKEPDACRALRSLEHATQALCRLAGQDDARCKDAAAALEQHRSRVKCP